MEKIRIALVGIGNCTSALVQGIHYYSENQKKEPIGLMHPLIGDYGPSDVKVVSAFDVDRRKVGLDLSQAIFSPPNNTTIFCRPLPRQEVRVEMGSILDSISEHMRSYPEDKTFVVSSQPESSKKRVIEILKDTRAEMLLNYLPVGSEIATRFYAECALEAGCAFINNIPVFIASDPIWANQFKEKKLPLVGDDIKSQCGATIIHRVLADLFNKRGVKLERTYQLNVGGNTDFLNMLERQRLISKKESKTQAVRSILTHPIEDENVHIGPSDYVPWQKDNKICFLRMEGKLFGNIPMHLELRLSVEDSPNSAGVAIDVIRCAKLALMRGEGGTLCGPASYFMKHPPRQFPDDVAYQLTEDFIHGHTSA